MKKLSLIILLTATAPAMAADYVVVDMDNLSDVVVAVGGVIVYALGWIAGSFR